MHFSNGPYVDWSSFWAEKKSAHETDDKLTREKNDIKHLREQIDKLSLACMAMWSLIKEKTNVTDEDLQKRMQEIDAADGQQDGTTHTNVQTCPQCGQTLSQRFKKCLYCGYQAPENTFAPGVG